jgi:hypothetical protein
MEWPVWVAHNNYSNFYLIKNKINKKKGHKYYDFIYTKIVKSISEKVKLNLDGKNSVMC